MNSAHSVIRQRFYSQLREVARNITQTHSFIT